MTTRASIQCSSWAPRVTQFHPLAEIIHSGVPALFDGVTVSIAVGSTLVTRLASVCRKHNVTNVIDGLAAAYHVCIPCRFCGVKHNSP